ncbi:MAG: sigma-70 family RNA polymerase sigma factor [Acidobacteriota bacterium]
MSESSPSGVRPGRAGARSVGVTAPVGDPPDAQLVAATAAGDRDAFRGLFDRHAGRVLSILRTLCRDAVLADDLLQDVFLQVWRRAETFDPRRGDFGGWLYILCRNRVADHFRRARPAVDEPPEEVDREPRVVGGPSRELQLALAQSLARLRVEERDVVRETYFSGRTYDEAALRLGIPLGTLKSRLRSALKKLSDGLTS